MLTTATNPGAFNPIRPKSWKRILKTTLQKLLALSFRDAINYFLSELINKINRYRSKASFYCNICHTASPYFIHIANKLRIKWNSACPVCNSRQRHRGLQEVYKSFKPGMRILHFAPEPVFYQVFKTGNFQYETADYFLKDVDHTNADIQNLNMPDSTYDVVLCNHVIEHVADEGAALASVCRILKPGGQAYITLPGDFRREKTIYFKDLTFNGHYRDYGRDTINRMNRYFSSVDVVDLVVFNSRYNLPMGITPGIDWLFICTK